MNAFDVMPTKETAACCIAARDELGRPPIGYCGPGCIRRAARKLLSAYHEELQRSERVRYRTIHVDPSSGWEPWANEWDDPTSAEALR